MNTSGAAMVQSSADRRRSMGTREAWSQAVATIKGMVNAANSTLATENSERATTRNTCPDRRPGRSSTAEATETPHSTMSGFSIPDPSQPTVVHAAATVTTIANDDPMATMSADVSPHPTRAAVERNAAVVTAPAAATATTRSTITNVRYPRSRGSWSTYAAATCSGLENPSTRSPGDTPIVPNRAAFLAWLRLMTASSRAIHQRSSTDRSRNMTTMSHVVAPPARAMRCRRALTSAGP